MMALAGERLGAEAAERTKRFLERYYARAAPGDLAAREPRDLLGAALEHLRLGKHRTPGTLRIHVMNPDLSQHGWYSPHTVVQIVTDDMPFLVDSVRMAVTTLGLGIHLVVHPMLDVERGADGEYVGCRSEEHTSELQSLRQLVCRPRS